MIIAISAIFFYLASVVVPIFMPAQMDDLQEFSVPKDAQEASVHLTSEEQAEIGVRMSDRGSVTFFDLRDGRVMAEEKIALPEGVGVSSFAAGDPSQQAVAYGLSDGRMLILEQDFKVTFQQDPDDHEKDIRTITPTIAYPAGSEPLLVDEAGRALKRLTMQHGGENTTAVALTEDNRLLMAAFEGSSNMITGEVTTERFGIELPPVQGEISQLLLEVKQRDLYVVHGGRFVSHYDVMDKQSPRLVQTVALVPEGESITAATMLSGGFSLIIGTDKGNLAQWFQVRDDDNVNHLTHIRSFKPMASRVTTMAPEHFRKGFLAGDDKGNVGLYYATSNRLILKRSTGGEPVRVVGIAPRANAIMVESEGDVIQAARVENEYPEISFSSLWQKVWYESYQEPEYNWQSSAATSDFEPKFSVAPLTFGTLEGGVLRHAGGGSAGGAGRHFRGLFHVAEDAQRGQAVDRDHGGAADRDPGFSRRSVAGALDRQQSGRDAVGDLRVAVQFCHCRLSLASAATANHRGHGFRLGSRLAGAGHPPGDLCGDPAGTPDRGGLLRRQHAALADERTRHRPTSSATRWWSASPWASR